MSNNGVAMNTGFKTFVNYELDNPSDTHLEFACTKVDSFHFPDSNNMMYNNKRIIFDSAQASGSNANKFFLISEGFLWIPYKYTVKITGGTFVDCNSNKNSCCIKGSHHLIDQIGSSSLGSATNLIDTGGFFRNVYINEKLKEQTLQENYLKGTMNNCIFDNHESYRLCTEGEMNNNTDPAYPVNNAIYERTKHLIDATGANRSSIPNSIGKPANLLMTEADLRRTMTPYFTYAADTLTYYEIVKLPLAHISDLYKNLNIPMANIENLRLELLLNQGELTVVYDVNANGNAGTTPITFAPNNQTWTVAAGQTNPFLLSSASNVEGKSALVMRQTANNTPITLKVTGGVSWGADSLPCRMVLKQMNLTAKISEQITLHPNQSIMYRDFFIDDSQKNKPKGAQVSVHMGAGAQRAISMYIVPFFSGDANSLRATQSGLTSCPNTCAYFRASDVQIRVGSEGAFYERPAMDYEFYDNVMIHQQGGLGNSVNAVLHNGLVSKEMWNTCYGVFKVDLADQSFEDAFGKAIKPQVQFNIISGAEGALYDFLFIFEYVRQLNINVTNSSTEQV
jgi:hypothetical protein